MDCDTCGIIDLIVKIPCFWFLQGMQMTQIIHLGVNPVLSDCHGARPFISVDFPFKLFSNLPSPFRSRERGRAPFALGAALFSDFKIRYRARAISSIWLGEKHYDAVWCRISGLRHLS